MPAHSLTEADGQPLAEPIAEAMSFVTMKEETGLIETAWLPEACRRYGGVWSANDRGAIHAVEWPPGLQKASVQETKTIFAAGLKKRSDLQKLLSHADFRVRQRAQFELVARNDSSALLQTLAGSDGLQAKLHALWGLGQLHRYGKGDYLAKFLAAAASDEVDLRVAACRILGDVRAPSAANVLLTCLDHASHRRHLGSDRSARPHRVPQSAQSEGRP